MRRERLGELPGVRIWHFRDIRAWSFNLPLLSDVSLGSVYVPTDPKPDISPARSLDAEATEFLWPDYPTAAFKGR